MSRHRIDSLFVEPGQGLDNRTFVSAPKHPTQESIAQHILVVRGYKVLLDADLARLYGVETRVLIQAVKRNGARFPEDFMFRLSREEFNSLRSQAVILKKGRGQHRKHLPYAFTEHGALMLGNVLRSQSAVSVSLMIVRTFVQLRAALANHAELAGKLDELEVACLRMMRRSAIYCAQSDG